MLGQDVRPKSEHLDYVYNVELVAGKGQKVHVHVTKNKVYSVNKLSTNGPCQWHSSTKLRDTKAKSSS
jgi:hypothetical protein